MIEDVAKIRRVVLNVGTDWLLFGDETAKDYPCGEFMTRFLKKHPEIRKGIWDKMQAKSECGMMVKTQQ